MKRHTRSIALSSLTAALLAFATYPATAQTDSHQQEQGAMGGMMGGRGTGGMMSGEGMGCMMGGGAMGAMMGSSGMPHLPPGNEKLDLQMHAEMMRAMSDILAKYGARLPDRKQ